MNQLKITTIEILSVFGVNSIIYSPVSFLTILLIFTKFIMQLSVSFSLTFSDYFIGFQCGASSGQLLLCLGFCSIPTLFCFLSHLTP
jgi:hypothetical protein